MSRPEQNSSSNGDNSYLGINANPPLRDTRTAIYRHDNQTFDCPNQPLGPPGVPSPSGNFDRRRGDDAFHNNSGVNNRRENRRSGNSGWQSSSDSFNNNRDNDISFNRTFTGSRPTDTGSADHHVGDSCGNSWQNNDWRSFSTTGVDATKPGGYHGNNANNAGNQGNLRDSARGFNSAANNSNSSSAGQNKTGTPVNPGDWPASLRAYVTRCFASCSGDSEKDATEVFLKNRLKTSETNGDFIWTTDWANEPTPFGSNSQQSCNPRNSGFNSSPSKVGFALKGKSRFQPHQNVFRATPEIQRAHEIAQSIKDAYNEATPPQNSSPRRGGGSGAGGRKPMYKPGDDDPQDSPRTEERRSGRGRPSRFSDVAPDGSSGADITDTPGRGGRGRGRGRGKGRGRGRGRGAKSRDDESGGGSCIGNITFDSDEKKEDRASRFKKENAISVSDTISTMMETATKRGGEDVHFSDVHLVGTMTSLEKPYLRLTCAPSPEQVRPEAVLVKSLLHIMNKWKKEQNYAFVCEQLKSIRQDLTIQNIKNAFAVKVYECHARIALEKLDTTEYNQCQTRLIDLYKENDTGNPLEFLCYRILYYIYIKNNSDAMKIVAKLSPKQKDSDDVKFGVEVFNAWTSGNYHKLFKLYLAAPKMSGYLMDSFIQRERNEAMKKLLKAYKPSITVAKISSLLGYPDDDTAIVYLDDLGVQYTDQKKKSVDCKRTVLDL